MVATTLEELRKNLDQLDQQLIRLLDSRAGIAREIWQAKQQTGNKNAFVPEREAEILSALRQTSPDNLSASAVENIFVEIISACRQVQNELHVCILGEKFGWVNDAAISRFGNSTGITAAENFEDFISLLSEKTGRIGFASFSPQNSIDHQLLLETLFSGKLGIIEEYNFAPEFCVVSNTACDLSEVHEICVTGEMLQQLRHYFISLSYDLKIRICRSMSEAYDNLQSINPVAAVIPSRLAGINRELRVIKTGLRGDSLGQVKFLGLSQHASKTFKAGMKTTLVCAINHTGERIGEIVAIMRQHGFKASDIHSFKSSGKPWETIVILELILAENNDRFKTMISELENRCLLVKSCGFYPVTR
jgi:chorismate mutase/prephenate dehydratase